jgi:predicted nucleotide-binding protein
LSDAEAIAESGGKNKRRIYVSQADVPRHTIEEALRLARAIADNYGKEPTRPLGVAQAMGMKPTTGKFETLAGASLAYGFTEGGAKAEKISLADLGRRIVAPTVEGDDLAAKCEALLRPRVPREFLKKYDGSPLPKSSIGQNVLEEMGVGADATERTLKLIIDSAEEMGLLTEINGTQYVNLEGVSSPPPETRSPDEPDETIEASAATEEMVVDAPPADQGGATPGRPTALFVGARKGKARDQLIQLLNEYRIPHKVAEDEAHQGRPIPKKVKDTMQECGAAILIFTADEEYHDGDGGSVWKPTDNVVHELGASSILYDDRIIVFKDERVSLASNFESIGYIEFSDGHLDAKANELLRELIAFKILTLSVNA